MNSKHLFIYALTKNGASEDYPFGPNVIVIKVVGKMFALMAHRDGQDYLSLKCNPDYAEILRQQYENITPGYHLNKRHWNTVQLDDSIPEKELREFIDHSYELVVKSLTREKRDRLVAEKK